MTNLITEQDVWLAIFSLDTYHRDYGAQVYTEARSSTHLGILRLDLAGMLGTAPWLSIRSRMMPAS